MRLIPITAEFELTQLTDFHIGASSQRRAEHRGHAVRFNFQDFVRSTPPSIILSNHIRPILENHQPHRSGKKITLEVTISETQPHMEHSRFLETAPHKPTAKGRDIVAPTVRRTGRSRIASVCLDVVNHHTGIQDRSPSSCNSYRHSCARNCVRRPQILNFRWDPQRGDLSIF